MDSDSNGSPASPAGEPLTMNSITGKLVLSLIRGNDYAHPGEEEAIELVFGPLGRSADSSILDVGCGIGGTARYVAERGWGKVTGIDLDPENVAVAKAHHPGLEFICSDVSDLERTATGPFDIIYLFTAFFLFPDKPAALRAMRAVARTGTRLALFDYVDRGGYARWQEHRETAGLRSTLELGDIEALLPPAGWTIDRVVPAHAQFERWYSELVARIEVMREPIVARSSEDFYHFVLTRYTETRDDVRAGRLGGATIYATAV